MDPAMVRSIFKSFLVGIIAVLVILVQVRETDPVRNPIIAFAVGIISRGLSQYISKDVDNAPIMESVREGLVGALFFFFGGVLPLAIGLTQNDLHAGTILGAVFGIYMIIVFLVLANAMYPNVNLDAGTTRVLRLLPVVVVVTSLMMYLSSLRS